MLLHKQYAFLFWEMQKLDHYKIDYLQSSLLKETKAIPF